MPLKCYNKPIRKRARVFTARDVGRIVAYARDDGADDAALIAHILAGFKRKELGCLLFRVLDIFNTGFFLVAVIGLLKGTLTLVKGIRILLTGAKSSIATSFLELIVPAAYWEELGGLLAVIGTYEAVASSVIIYLTAIANEVAIYLLAQGVCETDTPTYGGRAEPLRVGGIIGATEEVYNLWQQEKDRIENGYYRDN